MYPQPNFLSWLLSKWYWVDRHSVDRHSHDPPEREQNHGEHESRPRPPRNKTKFRAREKEPLAVAIVRGMSPSITERGLRDSSTAVEMLLDRLDEDDIASLIYFTREISIVNNFSIDKNKVKAGLKRPAKWCFFGTAIYDTGRLYHILAPMERVISDLPSQPTPAKLCKT